MRETGWWLRRRKSEEPVPAELPGADVIVEAVRQLARSYDPQHGGFGRGRKTPSPAQLGLLARYARRTGDATAVRMLDETLRHDCARQNPRSESRLSCVQRGRGVGAAWR